MKKAVKGSIIAASVAAVAGIGAVSFAYWSSSGSSGSGNAGGGTGNTVEAVGGINVAYNGGTALSSISVTDKLIPYDHDTSLPGHAQLEQPGESETWENVRYMVFTVTNTAGTDAGFTYKINGSLANPGGAKLLYKVGDTTTAPADTTGFTEMPATATAIVGDFTGVGEGTKVTVILDATGSAAINTNWNITFTADVGGDVETVGDYYMVVSSTGETTVKKALTVGVPNTANTEKYVYFAENVALNTGDKLTFNIKGKDIKAICGDNGDAGQVTIDATNKLDVTVKADGTYSVYLKQYESQANIEYNQEGYGEWCLWVGVPTANVANYETCVDGKVYLTGQFDGVTNGTFVSNKGYVMTKNASKDEYSVTVTLKAGDIIKIRDNLVTGSATDAKKAKWCGYNNTEQGGAKGSFSDSGDPDYNLVLNTGEDGTYTIYYKPNWEDSTKRIWIQKAV